MKNTLRGPPGIEVRIGLPGSTLEYFVEFLQVECRVAGVLNSELVEERKANVCNKTGIYGK